ncbi:uncharacterized protein LOC106657482 [Trichogramma pretiosum]|uniref:uncharacterized protein LOC106657482 n=1 Tax=Trichogramma pretiosum TaxID=7493 RepID=UPI0006C9D440|nr:uncharacterized protein LOC106657482 [Trichogramma pretiosum]
MANRMNESSLRLKREAFYREIAARVMRSRSCKRGLGQALAAIEKIVPGSEEVLWFSRRALRGQDTRVLRLLLELGLGSCHDDDDHHRHRNDATTIALRNNGRKRKRDGTIVRDSERGAEQDRNPADRYGLTYFHAACMSGHVASVESFIESGRVDLDQRVVTKHPSMPSTALHMAVKYGRLEVARLLLGAGADPRALDRRGRSALHRICEDGVTRSLVDRPKRKFVHDHEPALEIVKLLLDHGPDEIDREDDRGATPLQYAVASLQFELVEELLARGAKVKDVVFEGGYFDLARPRPSLRTTENLIGIVETLMGYGYEMSSESELKVMHFLMDVNMHEYDPEVDQAQLVLEYGSEQKIGDLIDQFESDFKNTPILKNMSTYSKLRKKSHEMMAIQRHLEVLHVGGMYKSANIRRLVDAFKEACDCYRGYFAVENFHWRFGESDAETTLLRSQLSTALTNENTNDGKQGGNDRIQNRITYEDDDESVEDDAVSEHNEHSHEDDWEMEAPDVFNRFAEETKRAGEIAIGRSGTTILDVCRAVPEERYNLLLTATKWPVIDEELRNKEFSLVGGVLEGIVDKTLVREYAAVVASKYFSSLLAVNMPYYCRRKIIGHLSNEDLLNLCTAAVRSG